uniref:Uncharacterized protein n=1 Tax=Anas platyrhynchos TaxID=8839 RepID=A0A8B9R847_ANAPL
WGHPAVSGCSHHLSSCPHCCHSPMATRLQPLGAVGSTGGDSGGWELGAVNWELDTGSWEVGAGSRGWELGTGRWGLVTGKLELGTGGWELLTGSWALLTGSWALLTGSSYNWAPKEGGPLGLQGRTGTWERTETPPVSSGCAEER